MELYSKEIVLKWKDVEAIGCDPTGYITIFQPPDEAEECYKNVGMTIGGEYLCLGEIKNMKGHYSFAGKDGKVIFGYHPENFFVIPEDADDQEFDQENKENHCDDYDGDNPYDGYNGELDDSTEITDSVLYRYTHQEEMILNQFLDPVRDSDEDGEC